MGYFIKVKGWISKEQIINEYQSSHVLIMPSIYEAMSISLLESLACGCYVITTPLNGVSEIISENGILVNLKSLEEIAKQIEEYFKNRFLSGYKANKENIDTLQKTHNWDHITNNYNHIFETIASSKYKL